MGNRLERLVSIVKNPNGPYPGRQLFLGLTESSSPCFAYLVTGRSLESRERRAVLVEDVMRIGPTGSQPYDPLRHYSAVKYDNNTGIVTVSNGIQTEAIIETYRLIFNTGSLPGKDFLEKILDGADAEPDSYRTPRIAGVITAYGDKAGPVFIIGIKGYGLPAGALQIEPAPGTVTGISTYKGDMDKPEARDPAAALPELKFRGRTAEELAGLVFDMSSASYKGNDIRVCAIGGVLSTNRKWELAIKNVHKV